MITENLSTLKIHKLTKEQYDRELASGNIDETALYLTPEEEIDLSGYATKNEIDGKADADHTHDDLYYTENEVDNLIAGVNTSITNITSGTTPVKEAEHAKSADTATNATNANHATSADSATTATSATKATQDENGNVITDTYETKSDAQTKLDEAKAYADSAATTVKNDLLNGAGEAYDTLKELGELIDVNVDAIDALETVASGKADKVHNHAISDVTDLQTTLDDLSEKANKSDLFVVNITSTTTDGVTTYSANKTYEEIGNAINEEKQVVAIFNNRHFDLRFYHPDNGCRFSCIVSIASGYSIITAINITKDNIITCYNDQLQSLANATGSLSTEYAFNAYPTAKAVVDYVGTQISEHNHDDVYYTETEVDEKLEDKQDKNFVVTVTSTTTDGTTTYSADKTFAEITEAVNNGKNVIANRSNQFYYLVVYNANFIMFEKVITTGSKASSLSSIQISKDNVVTHTIFYVESSGYKTYVISEDSDYSSYPSTKAVIDYVGTQISNHNHDDVYCAKTEFDTHVADTTKHITSTERTNWETAYTHSQSAHAPSNAQANVIESIKVNGTAQTITSKSVNITVPTDNASLTNGAGYITASAITNKADKATTLSGYGITDAYTKTEIDAKTTVDSALSSTSTNPVQNKVVNSAITTATSAITANTNSISEHTTAIANLQSAINDIQEITSAEISALFA